MDLKTYCRRHNVVPYHNFIADLKSKSIIFIGEVNHFSTIQKNNEEMILTTLAANERIDIATENISDSTYRSKREMFSRFSSSGLHYLPSENRQMLKQLEPILRGQKKLIVVVGSMHLNGPFSIDALVKRVHPEKSSVAVFLDDNITPWDIYKKHTPAGRDYIVAGNILI